MLTVKNNTVMKNLIFILIIALILPWSIYAQVSLERDIVSSSGRNAVAGSLDISWTLGEIAPVYYSSGGLILSAGFQQPDAVPATGIYVAELTAEIAAWPNPAGDVISYSINDPDNPTLVIGLYSLHGHMILEKTVAVSGSTYSDAIDLGRLQSGMYILMFTDRFSGATRSCHIIKMK